MLTMLCDNSSESICNHIITSNDNTCKDWSEHNYEIELQHLGIKQPTLTNVNQQSNQQLTNSTTIKKQNPQQRNIETKQSYVNY